MQSFIDMLAAAWGGTLPVVEGMTPQQIGAVVAAFGVSVEALGTRLPIEHFNAAIAPLQRIEIV